jgi:hypothetical protein
MIPAPPKEIHTGRYSSMHSLSTLRATAKQIGCVVGLLFVFCAVANAYTLVMRDGRRLEIPAQFIVTPSTVTYEVSPGMQITLNILAVDIPATERVNNEPQGSFVRRGTSVSGAAQITRTAPAKRTITNRELEPAMARRRASEIAYEKHRKEIGLPSSEESRRKAAAELTSFTNELREARTRQEETEAHWRERAFTLRSEIAAVDAELQYVRVQIDQPTFPYATGAFPAAVSVSTVAGFGGIGGFGRHGGFGGGPHRPIFVAPNAGARIAFGGTITRGQVFRNPLQRPFPGNFGGGVLPVGGFPFLGWGQPYDYSYERSIMINRFNELSARRLALNARWRELEDEGRRAGVPPGWLRK